MKVDENDILEVMDQAEAVYLATVSGSAPRIRAKFKEALWDEGWRIYWPGGPSDPDCVVVRLMPREATGWWGSEPFHLDLRAP